MTSATDFNITTEIERIKNKRTTDGIMGKMDEVLRLAKKGYDEASIEYGLRYFVRTIGDRAARADVLGVYLRRMKQRI